MGCSCSHQGHWPSDDPCADMHDDCSDHSGRDHCGCEHSGHEDCDCHRRRRPIRVGNVTVDCTPVTFQTPGQAKNIVSCPVSQTVMVPISQTTCVPMVTTVNTPPIITPGM